MPAVASVAVVSNLPQLDKLYDYLIPDELGNQTFVGSRVRVPFGRGSKIIDGFVLEIDTSSDFSGKLARIQEVVGTKPALSAELIEFLQEQAIRSASSLGEILKLAVPTHMPRTYKAHLGASNNSQIPEIDLTFLGKNQGLVAHGSRHAVLSRPNSAPISQGSNLKSLPSWVSMMCSIASINILAGKSSILAVPDFRDQAVLLDALESCNLKDFVANFSQEQPRSKIYEAYLRALDNEPRVIVGSRSVMLAPAHQLGSIAIFDEGDHSFTDQSAPYLNIRDSALLRQNIQNCSLIFMSHSRSTDIQRLVETGYLSESTEVFPKPKVSVSDPGFRVDSHAFKAIKKGLESGSVLVQVASKGESTALFCASCDKKISCLVCFGPVWVDGSGKS